MAEHSGVRYPSLPAMLSAMDVRDLRWFQQAVDGVTLTELADLEQTSQSGVSRALARLEAEVGTPLLRRAGRTLRPTRAGTVFKRHVDAAVHDLDDGLAAVQQVIDPETGTVSLAFQPSLGTWLVPSLIAGFRQEHPGVRFELSPKHDELTAAVGPHSDVDLELTTLRPRGQAVSWQLLTREPLVLTVPAGHRLAGRAQVDLAEAGDEPFVAIEPTSQLRLATARLCERAGFAPHIAYVCDDLPTMRAFVREGLGVAVLPAPHGAASVSAGIRHLPLTDRSAVREVGIGWSVEARMLPAARLFRDHVLACAAAGGLPTALPQDGG